MCDAEKRRFKRLPIKFELSCRRVDSAEETFHKGHTINVSPGGMYFGTASHTFESGDLTKGRIGNSTNEGTFGIWRKNLGICEGSENKLLICFAG